MFAFSVMCNVCLASGPDCHGAHRVSFRTFPVDAKSFRHCSGLGGLIIALRALLFVVEGKLRLANGDKIVLS